MKYLNLRAMARCSVCIVPLYLEQQIRVSKFRTFISIYLFEVYEKIIILKKNFYTYIEKMREHMVSHPSEYNFCCIREYIAGTEVRDYND